MKIRSEHIADRLEAMGWVRKGPTTVTATVAIYEKDDPRGTSFGHDFYYGPLVVRRQLPATKMLRPDWVSRRQEREVMKLLISFQEVMNMLDSREEGSPAYRALGNTVTSLLIAAWKVVRENE